MISAPAVLTATAAAGQIMQLYISKEDFKFSSAHFSAHGSERERLHGHNYRVSIWLNGKVDANDGCVIDFAEVKKAVRHVCKTLDERFLCPLYCPTIQVKETIGVGGHEQIELLADNGKSFFSFPKDDVILLPLRNSTVEELAVYISHAIGQTMGEDKFLARGVEELIVGVGETPGQEARFTRRLGLKIDGDSAAVAGNGSGKGSD